MIVTPVKTKKVVVDDTLEDILAEFLPALSEKSVVVITSKIVGITENNVVPLTTDKEQLIRQEASKICINNTTDETWKMLLTIKNNIIVPWAGIDESNGNGSFVLWPKDPMRTAATIWHFLRKHFGLKEVGVLITDSTFIPLRTGSVSIGIAWCGFKPTRNLINTPDVFGRPLQYTTTSFVDSLSISAGLTMGESNEQQPLAVIEDIPHIEFVRRTPNKEEVAAMHYPLEKDVYGPLIQAVPWEKGGRS